jgi:hypothetical protein
MEKKSIFWSILSIMMVAMLSIGLSSCSKDDDEGESASSKIIGTWHYVGYEYWDYDEGALIGHELMEYKKESATFNIRKYEVVNGKETGDYRDSNVSMSRSEFMFCKDGTFNIYYNDREFSKSGTYSASNDSLKWIYEGSNVTLDFKYSFKGDQLVLKSEDYNGKKLKYRGIHYFNKGAYPNK